MQSKGGGRRKERECQICFEEANLVMCMPCGHDKACGKCVARAGRSCAFCNSLILAACVPGTSQWTLPPTTADEARLAVEATRQALREHVETAADGREHVNVAFHFAANGMEARFLEDVALWRASLHPQQQETMHRMAAELRERSAEHRQ